MDGILVEYGEAQAGDVRIAYQVEGEGPPLICCHAMGWDQSLWDRHRARLSSAHRLITFDQRGCGRSEHPPLLVNGRESYTVDTFGADLRAVLEDLNIGKASVLGFSMGAVAALHYATHYPERVERLILASAMASRLPEPIIERARIVEEMLEREGLDKTYDFYFSGPLFDGVSNTELFAREIARVREKATSHGFQGCYRVTIDRPSMLHDLKRIQAPTLVLVGERDTHYLPEADLIASEIPDCRKIIVEGAGHPLAVQQPEVFQDQVVQFLSDLASLPPRVF